MDKVGLIVELDRELSKAKTAWTGARVAGDERNIGYYCGIIEALGHLQKSLVDGPDTEPSTVGKSDVEPTAEEYPQAAEANEYRHISPVWLDEIATGLTAGATKYPGETWRSIQAQEHAARAIRHLNLYRMGDRQDNHLINASMRCMMAYVTDQEGAEK